MAFLTAEKVDEVGANTAPDKRYMSITKLQEEKEYRIRFMGEGITGYEAWTTQNKPMRWSVLPDELPANIRVDENSNTQVAKYFVTGIVWDYDTELFRVLSITQKTVLDQLFKYMKDEDYGDAERYDIVLSRKGSDKNTKYSLLAKPPKAVAASIKASFTELDWDLTKLFANQNPWDSEGQKSKSDA
jgi:hypothetical protein